MGLFDFLNKKTSLRSNGLLQGFKDHHSHILFGVDDGVKTLEGALEVLSYAESEGVSQMWCTPHIMEDINTPTSLLQERFAQLKESYNGNISLHLAAEYMLDNEFQKRLNSGDILTIDGEMVLVETSVTIPPCNFIEVLHDIMSKGYRPILAHPERSRFLTMTDYEKLDSFGVYFQLNLPSIVGYYGETAQKKAVQILKNGWYYVAGSDCHRLQSYESQVNREVLTSDIIERLKVLLK